MIGDHLPIIVILTYFLASLLMPLAGLLGRRAPSVLAVAAGAAALGFSLMTLWKTLTDGAFDYAVGAWPPPVGIELQADPLSAFFLVVINLIGTVVLFHGHFNHPAGTGERAVSYHACVMLMLGGFSGIVGTADLFNLFVFLELSALAGYAILGNGSGRAAHSAFRYLILGTIGASFYLLGLGFLYAETGSLNMGDVALILDAGGMGTPARIGFVFIILGICLKMALLPLHQWLPDVYTDAPPMGTALVAPIGTKVAVYVLIRVLYDVFPAGPGNWAFPLHGILSVAGAAAILWGSVMAIPQTNLKRMLAYSSVAQIGYIALGIGLATPFGYIGAVLHVFNHALMKACLFLYSARLESAGLGVSIDRMGPAIRRRLPVATACFVIAAISMIGLPPTAGFFSKWYLILGSYESGNWAFVGIILASSLLNAVYFFRIIERIYLGDTEEGPAEKVRVRLTRRNLALVAFAVSILLAGLFNLWIVRTLIEPMLPAF
ncbi:MAG: complex I subunit 5 family protein [Oceanipulchritudo sp.]